MAAAYVVLLTLYASAALVGLAALVIALQPALPGAGRRDHRDGCGVVDLARSRVYGARAGRRAAAAPAGAPPGGPHPPPRSGQPGAHRRPFHDDVGVPEPGPHRRDWAGQPQPAGGGGHGGDRPAPDFAPGFVDPDGHAGLDLLRRRRLGDAALVPRHAGAAGVGPADAAPGAGGDRVCAGVGAGGDVGRRHGAGAGFRRQPGRGIAHAAA